MRDSIRIKNPLRFCGLLPLTLLLVPALASASTFTHRLAKGSMGGEVTELQQILAQQGLLLTPPTGYFGALTFKAVEAFQTAHGLKALGEVGPQTRSILNAVPAPAATSTATTTPAAINNTLTIEAVSQPTALAIPAGALGVPFTNLKLTAGTSDVTVNSVTVEQHGMAGDGVFDTISLLDEGGVPLADEGHLRADHKAVLEGPFTIPAGTSKLVTVAGDMIGDLSGYDGEEPLLQVDAIDASSPVAGAFPITGAAPKINALLPIGSAEVFLSVFDPDNNSDHYINDTNVRFSGIKITAGPVEDLKLYSIAWDQTGTAGSTGLANVATVVQGAAYPSATDGTSFTSTFPGGILVPRGTSVDVYVQGDLTPAAAQRTVEFDIDDPSDINLVGQEYGFQMAPAPGGNTAESGNSAFITSDGTPQGDVGDPFFAGSIVTVQGGTFVQIQNAN